MDDKIAIRLENVSKTFTIRDRNTDSVRDKVFNLFNPTNKRVIRAVKNISLEIKKGEFFGVIGRNGCGKSTLLQLMAGVYPPDKGGKSAINGRFIRLSLGLGFNKELTARENIYINASILGLSLKRIGKKFDEIIEMSELSEFVDTKIKYFSRGMRSKLAFAIAIHAEADILLMDEFFGGVGDERFKKKSDEIFKRTFLDGRTIVHVSHNLETIRQYCDRVILLDKGRCIALGTPDDILDIYNKQPV